MLDTTEADFVRSIAAEDRAPIACLVFADWLEERGDYPRANFIRVQCERETSPDLGLRKRERELLDAHRQEWCQALRLPVEDVRFERGLIAGVRLSLWEDGKLLDPAYAARLATLTELDLSGLAIGDSGLAAIAEKARFPALRKLIVSDNQITNAGAKALATAGGLPRLDTVYLFQNDVNYEGRYALEKSSHFLLANLDLGERAEGYSMSAGEAEMARRQYIRTQLLPVVSQNFQTYERLQSAVLCVAQYWNDEANDAVHGCLVVSELFEPTLMGVNWGYDEANVDPNLPDTQIQPSGQRRSSMIGLWDAAAQWDDNSGAIPLWAAFAPEEGHQEWSYLDEVYSPAVMFYRHGGYDILPMCRPQLDGVQPEWDGEGG